MIHGDPNDYNVIVKGGEVVGFLDFSGLVYSATVCDLAIATAYGMLEKTDPFSVVGMAVAGYSAQNPLSAKERQAVYPLAISRLCMSVCWAAYYAKEKREGVRNALAVGAAWELLEELAEGDLDAAEG